MRHQLGLWAVLPLVLWQVAQAQTFKCDDADGKGRGYTINDSAKHNCQEGTFCYQLGKGVYCGVGSSDSTLAEPNSVAGDSASADKAVSNACAKDGTAMCKLSDGHGAEYYRCIDGATQDFKCGGGSVCYKDGEGVVCGASSSVNVCTPGALKCSAADGTSADFSQCIGGEQVALVCGVGLTCSQDGPFHVRCASDADGNARVEYPVSSAEPDSSTCAVAPEPTSAPCASYATVNSTIPGTTTTTTTITVKPSMYTVTKNPKLKANGPTLVRSNANNARPNGLNMMEIDVSYDPAGLAPYPTRETAPPAAGTFEQPDAFSREIANCPIPQGYGSSSTSANEATAPNPPNYAPASTTVYPNSVYSYPSPNSYPAQPLYTPQPSYDNVHVPRYQPLALNAAIATVIPDNMPLPQLLYSLQNAMQFAGPPPNAPYMPSPIYSTAPPPPPPPPPVYSATPPPTTGCPTNTKPITHTVFISVETNCEKPKPTCSSSEPECEPECSSETKRKHKHKHKHNHKHKHKKDDDDECSTTTSCPTTSSEKCTTSSSEECETSSKKHKHKHKHEHKHKKKDDDDSDDECESSSKEKKGECECEECDGCCQCFGRAVMSISSCEGETVTTLGKKLFAYMSNEESATAADEESVDEELGAVMHNAAATSSAPCESSEEPTCSSATTHTVYEAVETGCKCGSKGGKECKCGDKCTCKSNSHTVIVTVDSSCEKPKPKPTASSSHVVIESVETSCITQSPKQTRTVIQSIECSCITPSPKNTHTVIESIECSCITPSPKNTRTIIESIECICVKPTPTAPKNTHTVYESVECGCGPSCGKNTHVVLESVESGCASSSLGSCKPSSSSCESSSAKSTHFVYEVVESGCASSSSSCAPTSKVNTHFVYQMVESGCASPSSSCKPTSDSCAPTSAKNTHYVYQMIESGCASSSESCKPPSSSEPTSSVNTHTVYQSVESGCASSSSC
ncbi:hypothetical protein GGI20_003507 [Coemansia sp. BCRC 34301]|nr:hypothetical protein GGI20_003507 [Coemansia sp. BCRC 34301]